MQDLTPYNSKASDNLIMTKYTCMYDSFIKEIKVLLKNTFIYDRRNNK